jgi:hypothetical protein
VNNTEALRHEERRSSHARLHTKRIALERGVFTTDRRREETNERVFFTRVNTQSQSDDFTFGRLATGVHTQRASEDFTFGT